MWHVPIYYRIYSWLYSNCTIWFAQMLFHLLKLACNETYLRIWTKFNFIPQAEGTAESWHPSIVVVYEANGAVNSQNSLCFFFKLCWRCFCQQRFEIVLMQTSVPLDPFICRTMLNSVSPTFTAWDLVSFSTSSNCSQRSVLLPLLAQTVLHNPGSNWQHLFVGHESMRGYCYWGRCQPSHVPLTALVCSHTLLHSAHWCRFCRYQETLGAAWLTDCDHDVEWLHFFHDGLM